jgi:hypothetical protein
MSSFMLTYVYKDTIWSPDSASPAFKSLTLAVIVPIMEIVPVMERQINEDLKMLLFVTYLPFIRISITYSTCLNKVGSNLAMYL